MAGTTLGISNSTLASQGIGLFGSLFSTHMQNSANADAAKIQADAVKYATDQQAKSDAAQQAYLERQAAQTQSNFEATQKANYGQYASRQRDINALGSLVGAPQRNIPDYVPTTTVGGPSSGSLAGAAPPSANAPTGTLSGPAPTVDWTADPATLTKQLTGYFAAKGAPATEVPYWVGKAGELVARGKEINNPNYANERLAAADVLGGGAPATARVAASAPLPGSLSAAYLPFQQAPNLTLRGY